MCVRVHVLVESSKDGKSARDLAVEFAHTGVQAHIVNSTLPYTHTHTHTEREREREREI